MTEARSKGQFNPFADVGSVVTADRFIGRKTEIELLSQRVLNSAGYGSIAVVGMPKVGKTSLVHHIFQENPKSLIRRNIIVSRFETGTFGRWQSLFQAMVLETCEAIVRADRASSALIEISHLLQEAVTDDQLLLLMRRFFRSARHDGLRLVIILDEFDAARYIFSGADRCFHLLRELASNPEFKVALVIVSKRELDDVARMAGHDSNYWANVLTTCYLRPFEQAEAEMFFEVLRQADVQLDRTEREWLLNQAGTHPFLMDLIGFSIVRRFQAHEAQIIPKQLDSEFMKLFKSICEVLDAGKRLSKLVQIVVGPVRDATQIDIDALSRYGVLSQKNGRLQAFADSFGDYLAFAGRALDVWPLWRETETSLRRAVTVLLRQFYGKEWEKGLIKAKPNLTKIIENSMEEKAKERERFGTHGSDNTLDYTYPNDLLAIMSSNWREFGKPLLGQDVAAWAPKFSVLAKVRNPLAHNRDVNLTYERQLTEAYCSEILDRLIEWEAKNGALLTEG